MNLIADSGSTTTNWRIADCGKVVAEISSQGINPFYMTEEEICSEIEKKLAPYYIDYKINNVFFYGAGCAFEDKKNTVRRAILKNFPFAAIEINSDLLGAARALFSSESGTACILGTGSNSCFYDGKTIVKNVSPLGYILGDEGSGAVLGRLLVADVLKNQLPQELIDGFFAKYCVTPQEIMENVYRKPLPNRYLAGFAPFLSENINHKSVYRIVYRCFDDFFRRNIMQYPANERRVGFVGSVAAAFKDTLGDVAESYNLKIVKILSCPINELVKFHSINVSLSD